jgi:hypothetical protein
MRFVQAMSLVFSKDQRSAPYQPGVKPQERVRFRAEGLKARSNSGTGSIWTGLQPSVMYHSQTWGFTPGWDGTGPRP